MREDNGHLPNSAKLRDDENTRHKSIFAKQQNVGKGKTNQAPPQKVGVAQLTACSKNLRYPREWGHEVPPMSSGSDSHIGTALKACCQHADNSGVLMMAPWARNPCVGGENEAQSNDCQGGPALVALSSNGTAWSTMGELGEHGSL